MRLKETTIEVDMCVNVLSFRILIKNFVFTIFFYKMYMSELIIFPIYFKFVFSETPHYTKCAAVSPVLVLPAPLSPNASLSVPTSPKAHYINKHSKILARESPWCRGRALALSKGQ